MDKFASRVNYLVRFVRRPLRSKRQYHGIVNFVLLVISLAGAAMAVPQPKSASSNTGTNTTKVTIEEGQTKIIRCTEPNVVLSIVEAAYTGSLQKKSSSPITGKAPSCNEDTSVRITVGNVCDNKPSCSMDALDEVNDFGCTNRRPLVIEYKCTAPDAVLETNPIDNYSIEEDWKS